MCPSSALSCERGHYDAVLEGDIADLGGGEKLGLRHAYEDAKVCKSVEFSSCAALVQHAMDLIYWAASSHGVSCA